MKPSSWFLLLVVLLGILGGIVSKKADDPHVTSNTDNGTDDNNLVQLNPDFVESEKTEHDLDRLEEGDDGEIDEEEEEEDELSVKSGSITDFKSVKGALAKALKKSRYQSKRTMKFAKKYRREITIGLTLFAFRREILQAIFHLYKKQFTNPETGKFMFKKLDPTAVLKLALFIDVARRAYSKQGTNTTIPDHQLQALALLGQSNPILKLIVSRVVPTAMYNPAYVPPIQQHYMFERLNERYIKDGMALHKAIHSKQESFKWPSSDPFIILDGREKMRMNKSKSNDTVVVLDLTQFGSSFENIEELRDQVSFLLSEYRVLAMLKAAHQERLGENAGNETNAISLPELEVVCLLESPGGSAADFGLAAQQLLRLRKEPGIQLTICVDKVAASGGYMIACTSSPGRLFAAPFALVGSIGVYGQIVNVQKVLEGWGMTPLVFRGGKDKAPLGIIGEVTSDGKNKVQDMIDDTHRAFKRHVVEARPILKKSIEEIGNGEVWLGYDALDNKLIDRITTSDEYIGSKVEEGARVLKIVRYSRPGLFGTHGYRPHRYLRSDTSLTKMVSKAVSSAMNVLGFRSNLDGINEVVQSETVSALSSARAIGHLKDITKASAV